MSTANFAAVLFDLDGTLLQVEMRHFIPRYVAGFHNCCSDLVDFERLMRVMRSGIRLLLETVDGSRSNEDRLFAFAASSLELDELLLRERFARFLATGLDELADAVLPIPEAPSLLEHCRRAGVPLVLATNPVFPRTLIEARCRWAGIDLGHFEFLTCFENSYHCKPQPGYFLDIAAKLQVDPKSCLMIGNDTSHDLAATEAGMTTWLVDSFLLERNGPSWEPDYRGDHRQLLSYLREQVSDPGAR
jgi:FMN phosphatase YigB (HAD superfamily)